MKRTLWIVGIIIIVACVILLLLAAWNLYAYHHVLDGSPALYDRLHQRAIFCLILGMVFAAVAAVCMIVRTRL